MAGIFLQFFRCQDAFQLFPVGQQVQRLQHPVSGQVLRQIQPSEQRLPPLAAAGGAGAGRRGVV